MVSPSGLRVQLLGPLRVWRDGIEVEPGPRQQAYLLALLVARAGQSASVSDLIDLIWEDDAPATALNVVHKYVGSLRRVLEPALPPRGTGSYIQNRGNGYHFTADGDVVDVVVFSRLVAAARAALADRRSDEAFDIYLEALSLWHGPSGDGLKHGPAAGSIFTALDSGFFDACVSATELAIWKKSPELILRPLRLAASMAPLNESVQAAIVTALAAAGHQAEALTVYRRARARLLDELGVDPGPALQAAHQQVLTQPGLPPAEADDDPAPPRPDSLVGRVDDLVTLRKGTEEAFSGRTGLVFVEGEPGSGKTRLLEEIAAEVDARGALVVWGRCLAGDGTPAMWPWVRAIGTMLDALSDDTRTELLADGLGPLLDSRSSAVVGPILPETDTQFRLFERVVTLVSRIATERPLVLVLDDLQWADAASLRLLDHLAARLPDRTALIGALRTHAPVPGSELSRSLAAASRLPGHHRIRLGPLTPAEVAELVRRETGQAPGVGTTRSMHLRTSGNPFFVRELSRLLTADGGPIAPAAAGLTGLPGVPATVRDVVRDRMAGLDDVAGNLLRIAALVGREVDLSLLARVAGDNVQACLDRLEPAEALGLLEPVPGDPFAFRFAHDLVRESVTEIIPPATAATLHLAIADALEHDDPSGESIAESLAHHLWSAGPLADPARTVGALIQAGRRAAAKSALEAAERHLRLAAQMARTGNLPEWELSALSQLIAVFGMRDMYSSSAHDLLARAEQVARGLGRELDAAGFLYSRWVAHSSVLELDRSGPLAQQLLREGEASHDLVVRAYGLFAWGLHQWDIGNVGEAFQRLSDGNRILIEQQARGERDPVRRDLNLLMNGMLAEISALHGYVDAGRRMLDAQESAAGDDPYEITVATAIASRTAPFVGDPIWALRAARRGIAVDPDYNYDYLGTYQRLARSWALAMTGQDARGAATELQELISERLENPTRACIATWHALLGEAWLAADDVDRAVAALDRGDEYVERYGQRYPEGLLLLVRAKALRVRGAPTAEVRAVAERARVRAREQQTFVFVQRAERLLAELDDD